MIKIDSRKIQEGDTFVAIKGYKTDGHNYIEDAIKNGAKKIIAQHGNYEVEKILRTNIEKYNRRYDYNRCNRNKR